MNSVLRVRSLKESFWKPHWEKMALLDSNGREHQVFDSEITKDIDEKLNLSSNETILNIGCGTGILESAFPSYQIFSIDFARNMLRKNVIKNGIVADASYLPFKPNSFDKICAYSVLQYVGSSKASKMIEEISVCQKARGLCLLGDVELLSNSPLKLLRYVIAYLLVKNRFYYYSIARIRGQCNQRGLNVKVLKQAAYLPFSDRRVDLLLSVD